MRIATNNTAKCRLRGSVGFIHMSTATCARRIAGVNRFDLNAVPARNVRGFQEERREGPAVVNQALLLSDPDSRPNALKVFDGNRPGINFQGFVNDLVRHVPEQPINRPLLFARQPFQESSLISALVPCGLKIAALFESALSNVFDNSAVESLAGVDCGDANDPRIDADHAVTLRVGDVLCDDQMQIPDSAFAGDGGSRLDSPCPVEILPVVVGEDQLDSHSAVERGQRGVLLIDFDRQSAGVISHRRRFFPAVMFFFVSLVRLRNHAASGASEIGGKFSYLSDVPISDVVKRDRIKDFLLKGDLRSVIERDHVGLLCLRKRLRSLPGRLKFYLQRDSRLHIGVIYPVNNWYCKRGLRRRIASAQCRFPLSAISRQSPSAETYETQGGESLPQRRGDQRRIRSALAIRVRRRSAQPP